MQASNRIRRHCLLKQSAVFAVLTIALSLSGWCADQGTIFIVRHGEKASSAAGALLSAAGHQRARCLAQTLKDANVQAIFTPEVKRTQQTAEPLANARHLSITVIPRKSQPELVEKARAAAQNGDVLIVAQQDTIEPIVQQLGGGTIPPLGDNEFDRLVIVHLNPSGSSVTTLRYCDCGARTRAPGATQEAKTQGMAAPK